ncbi:hypothetical protein [Candidatus Poriferisodalis sp.]|uniref:hypothetical protein n=1 Tax=Candidatus Poriferisodalis sp. TaxID=3101277 RepID=UPI003AF913DD
MSILRRFRFRDLVSARARAGGLLPAVIEMNTSGSNAKMVVISLVSVGAAGS